MRELQRDFELLVSNDLNLASQEQVKNIALGIWHEGFVPEVSHLSGKSVATAGYTIDKLMRFNCVPLNQKVELRDRVSLLKSKSTTLPIPKSKQGKRDPLAVSWGLNSDLKTTVKKLLPYQTRHAKI